MSIACVVCGEWYRLDGRNRLDICPPCFEANFAGAQPSFDVRHTPDPSVQAFTPRQLQALRRITVRAAQEDTP